MEKRRDSNEVRLDGRAGEDGAIGYVLLWLIGIPIPILLWLVFR
jgi:hypothetical protein